MIPGRGLTSDEILVEVRVPVPAARSGGAYATDRSSTQYLSQPPA